MTNLSFFGQLVSSCRSISTPNMPKVTPLSLDVDVMWTPKISAVEQLQSPNCHRDGWLFFIPVGAGILASFAATNIFITAGCLESHRRQVIKGHPKTKSPASSQILSNIYTASELVILSQIQALEFRSEIVRPYQTRKYIMPF